MTSFASITSLAAKEAIELYFEPLRQVARWFQGPDDRSPEPAALVKRRAHLLVDEVRDEHIVEQGLPNIGHPQLLDVLRGKTVFLTSAGHPYATKVGEWLLANSAQVCLVDQERKRVDVMKKWLAMIGGRSVRTRFAFGNLSDEDWLCRTLEAEQPDVILDFTTHVYLQAHAAARLNIARQSRRYQYIYDKGETITNIVRCSVLLRSVNAVVLVMPRDATAEVVDHFSLLYANVLRDQTDPVGAHVGPEAPTISVWTPRRGALLQLTPSSALAALGINTEIH